MVDKDDFEKESPNGEFDFDSDAEIGCPKWWEFHLDDDIYRDCAHPVDDQVDVFEKREIISL